MTATPAAVTSVPLQALAKGELVGPLKHVTSLWAGYGTLSRGTFRPTASTDGKSTTGKRAKSAAKNTTNYAATIPVMVKTIHFDDTANDTDLTLPNLAVLASTEYADPKTGDLGHRRKVRSYRVEYLFYAQYLSSPTTFIVANFVPALSRASPATITLSMTELPESASLGATPSAVLAWLASFHAHFLGTQPEGLWETGGYWHVATRPSELRRAQNARGSPYQWVALHADFWAQHLAKWQSDARCRTLVHGDPKGDNVVVLPDGQVALVDFQYVGGGIGAVDVAHWLATSAPDHVLNDWRRVVIDEYYAVYAAQAAAKGKEVVDAATVVDQVEVALLDWARFVAGWGWWGNVRWLQRTVQEIRDKWVPRT
ncbi:hypothetical protein GGF31_001028 [Allomyces arbusculus]|nr:hypothetical protein GGF31_001028 [Allomyces arbusculus]